jgi:TRAP-type C4-dicarboxylate transport system permease small subunit
MKNLLSKIKNRLTLALEIAVIIITGLLVLDVVWQVFTRFVLKDPSTWTEELATMLLMWMALLGASVTFARKGHLGVDYFVGKLSPKNQVIAEIVAYIFITFFAVIMVYGGYKIVSFTLNTNQTSAALGIKMGYVYLSIPISGFFILILSIENLYEKLSSLKGKA